MMGSVRERTEEIGIFRAIGFRKRHVMKIVFMEAAIVSGLAGVIGYVIGLGSARVAIRFFSEGQPGPVTFDFTLAAVAFAIALLVGMVASAYPAFLAARMDPNEAFRAL